MYMKATGIVRRIDDLGRIVVPREIRRTLHIREGEPMEIFTGRDGEIILKKYSMMGELGDYAIELAESMAQATGHLVLIADYDMIVAAAGQEQKEYMDKRISRELGRIIAERQLIQTDDSKNDAVMLLDAEKPLAAAMVIQPIISGGDAIGAVILIGTQNPVGDTEVKLAQTASGFLGKRMEE